MAYPGSTILLSGVTLPQVEDNITFPAQKGLLTYMLECPVCTDYMTGIVHLCIMGHSMCSDCYAKLVRSKQKCPLCRKSLSPCAARNYILESLAAACKFKCKFAERGCTTEVEGHLYNRHIKECSYRDLSCTTFQLDPFCSKLSLQIKEFINHLKQDHDVPVVENGSWIERSFNVKGEIINPPLVMIEFDNQVFFCHITNFPKGPAQVPTIYQYLLNRWILKADAEGDWLQNSSKTYRYEISTKFIGIRNDMADVTANLVSVPSLNSNVPSVFQTQDRKGHSLLLSNYPRDPYKMLSQEDDNSLFGFSLTKSLNDFPPNEIVWNERIIISKQTL